VRKSIPTIRSCASLWLLLLASGAASGQDPWAASYQLEAQGEYVAAIEALAVIMEADAAHEFAVLRTAWLRYLDGDYNASIRGYRRALELNAQSLEARLGLTLPLLAQQRWREAAGVAQEVLAFAPWNYYAHLRLMVAEEGQRQWQTLARHAREAGARYPSDPTILVYLARAESRQGNLPAALAAYAAVLERVPGHEEATAFLAANGN
jgi:tetratricopeptide (TPR) repeat protein